MKKHNIGIIGYGGFGKFLHHWWSRLESVEIVAISDGSLDKEESGSVKYYNDWKDLLSNDEVEIVSIATPPASHVEIACAAMRRNKHVILEKPIAITIEGAQEILRTQQETGAVMTINHMLRYNPIIQALIDMGREEIFGKLRHAVINNYAQDESLPARHWFWDKAVSGGIFIEHGVHFFDIVNALTSQKISEVYGCSHMRNGLQEDKVSSTVLYDEGLIANHYHSFSGPGFFEQTTITLKYDLAKIGIEGWIPMNGNIKALVNKKNVHKLKIIPGLTIESITPITDLTDISRPEGWGDSIDGSNNTICFGGLKYDVQEMVSAIFKIPRTKSEVYGECLQKILSDLITNIEERSHKMAITPYDAYTALRIAVLADQSANGS